ncbi:MAG TPA: DUF6496 domain-containing protein [Rhodopila sp.]|nr:DUF6496 domain-containing protein [Rhodopila sp.]
MARQNPEQKKIVGRVMHEFKHGELKRGRGGKVQDPRQAVAIALSEAGASNQQSPAEKRRNLKRTETRQRRGKTPQGSGKARSSRPAWAAEPTRAELYRKAQQAHIPGRSRMNKGELQHALAQH